MIKARLGKKKYLLFFIAMLVCFCETVPAEGIGNEDLLLSDGGMFSESSVMVENGIFTENNALVLADEGKEEQSGALTDEVKEEQAEALTKGEEAGNEEAVSLLLPDEAGTEYEGTSEDILSGAGTDSDLVLDDGDAAATDASAVGAVDTGHPMYRLYNRFSGEHFYTANMSERDQLVGLGWKYEGVGWIAPSTGTKLIYRLYNPKKNFEEHHYTGDAYEIRVLTGQGWNLEGPAWYSDDSYLSPVFRLFNPQSVNSASSHHYTMDENEYRTLLGRGWRAEGVAWYGLVSADPGPDEEDMDDDPDPDTTEKVSIRLCDENGVLLSTVELDQGADYTFTSIANSEQFFMGWTAMEEFTGNDYSDIYHAGEVLKNVQETVTFTAVMMNPENEPNIPASELPSVDPEKYQAVIFVGDSRTGQLSELLREEEYADYNQHVFFLSRYGQGYNWISGSGLTYLRSEIERVKGDGTKPVAVISNLGINDLENVDKYISFYAGLIPELTENGCEFFFMSVNPVNNAQITYAGTQGFVRQNRLEADVYSFNNQMYEGLKDYAGYIDTCTYLLNNGFSTATLDYDFDDGLHYSKRTLKRIFAYAMQVLMQ